MKHYNRILTVTAFAAALMTSACSDLGTEPDRLLAPDQAVLAKGGRSDEAKAGKQDRAEKKGARVRGRKKNGQEVEYTVPGRRGSANSQVASAWIDANGGSLKLGNHTLYVPAGAVSERTHFSMREANLNVDGVAVLALDMNASRGVGRHESDVGAAGFPVPVTLCVGHQDVELVQAYGDSADLIWFKNSTGVTESVDGRENGAGQFCGDLDHFSLWGLGWP